MKWNRNGSSNDINGNNVKNEMKANGEWWPMIMATMIIVMTMIMILMKKWMIMKKIVMINENVMTMKNDRKWW